MCTTVRELWLTGWKGKKGGLHERVRERERERFGAEYGQQRSSQKIVVGYGGCNISVMVH